MVSNRINKLRKESGLNQKELGTMIGVGQTTISAWETGKNEPDNESMNKMAKYFRVSIGYLMGYEDNPYTGLSKEVAEQYNKENRNEFLKRIEEEQSKFYDGDYNPGEEIMAREINDQIDFDEWQKTDQATYFEFFKLNKMGDYLSKEQRQRILDVAKVMFPNAEKGLYTEEITQEQTKKP